MIVPQRRPASILAKPEPDPAFALADIAFGQPDLESIARSENLRWIHISTAGFTRYDTPEFRALVAERGILVSNSSSVYARPARSMSSPSCWPIPAGSPGAASHAANGDEEWLRLRGESVSLHGQHLVILGFGGNRHALGETARSV